MKKLMILGMASFLFMSCNNTKTETKVETITETKTETISNVSVVNGIYESFAKGDIDGFVAALDEKVEWNEAENFPYDGGNPYIGPQAVVDGVLGPIGGEWDNFSVVETKVLDMANDMVLVTGRYTGTNKKTGKSVNAQLAHLWTLKNGKVIQFQQYTDTKQFADAIAE